MTIDLEYLAASRRWAAINQQTRVAGCRCGRPATEVQQHDVIGSVPAETWTCADHVGVSAWAGTTAPDRSTTWTPAWERSSPCESCTGTCTTGGPIGGPTTRWHCPNGKESS